MVSAEADGEDLLFVGTPLDNFVHAVLSYSELLHADTLTEQEELRWAYTVLMLASLVRDSFVADRVFYLQTKEREDTYDGALDLLISEALAEFGIDFVVLDGTPEQNADLCGKMIRSIQEGKVDNSDTENEDGTGSLQPSVEEESTGPRLVSDSENLSDNE
jgi:hypothetical protein